MNPSAKPSHATHADGRERPDVTRADGRNRPDAEEELDDDLDTRDIALLKIGASLTGMPLLDGLMVLAVAQATLLKQLPPAIRISTLMAMREDIANILRDKEPGGPG